MTEWLNIGARFQPLFEEFWFFYAWLRKFIAIWILWVIYVALNLSPMINLIFLSLPRIGMLGHRALLFLYAQIVHQRVIWSHAKAEQITLS